MEANSPVSQEKWLIPAASLQDIFKALQLRGYQVVGPAISDHQLVYQTLSSIDGLPRGWRDQQEGGVYRLEKTSEPSYFGYNLGQHSWKKFLFPAEETLWEARREGLSWRLTARGEQEARLALVGVRACELASMAVQDRVFLQGKYADPLYRARRESAFILAVNCTRAGGACFCASLGTGPQVTRGFDLALTEIVTDARQVFVVEVGTQLGGEVLAGLQASKATPEEAAAAAQLVAEAARRMGRRLDWGGLKEVLYQSYDHPHWDEVAGRCLTCGNCAMVCPTCFCHAIDDTLDLTGSVSQRRRRWEVCFTLDHSYIHGGSVRPSAKGRYRQWLIHKLAAWQDQFGCLGCVGCGRCLTWCPVGIDITQEAAAFRVEVTT